MLCPFKRDISSTAFPYAYKVRTSSIAACLICICLICWRSLAFSFTFGISVSGIARYFCTVVPLNAGVKQYRLWYRYTLPGIFGVQSKSALPDSLYHKVPAFLDSVKWQVLLIWKETDGAYISAPRPTDSLTNETYH